MVKPREHLRVGGKSNEIVTELVKRTTQWADIFERIQVKSGQGLYRAGMRTPFIYAPIDAVISSVTSTGGVKKNGKAQPDVTLNVLGGGDLVGVNQLLGEAPMSAGAICDMGGSVLRASTQVARRLMDSHEESRHLILAYANLATAESWQWMAASVQLPNITRIAAYLLINWQTSGSRELPVTHYLMSSRMDMRRPSITEALAELGDGIPGVIYAEPDKPAKDPVPGLGLIKQNGTGRILIQNPEGLMNLVSEAWPLYGTHRQAFRDALALDEA